MTAEWSVPAWAVLVTLGGVLVLAALLVAVLVLVRRSTQRVAQAALAARAEADVLRGQVAAIERRLGAAVAATPHAAEAHDAQAEQGGQPDYVITRLGQPTQEDVGAVPAVDAPLFADLVLRESVVQAASLAAGLRRAMAPAHLNRIRFEMRREVKRARKQRRADVRRAKREYGARDRARDGAGEAAA